MLNVEALSFYYSERKIIKDISFTATPGEMVSIAGPSGVGKSTLARIIAGHLPPASGRILVDSVNVTGKPSQKVFMISQEMDLFPWQTVSEHLEFAYASLSKAQTNVPPRTSLDEVLELVQLHQSKSLYPRELSGGMQRRLALARALVLKPRVMILDEVFGSQDETLRDSLLQSLKPHWKSIGTIALIISHDRDVKAAASDRTVLLA